MFTFLLGLVFFLFFWVVSYVYFVLKFKSMSCYINNNFHNPNSAKNFSES